MILHVNQELDIKVQKFRGGFCMKGYLNYSNPVTVESQLSELISNKSDLDNLI
jgi:hypothetical protein